MKHGLAGSLLAFLLVTGSCGVLTEPDPGDTLTSARRLWLTTGPVDYQYEITRSCECLFAGNRIRVSVLAGRVHSAWDLGTNQPVEPSYLTSFATVPGLFDQIELAIAQRAVLLEVDYDEQDGHPTRISVDVSRTIVDDEYTLSISNLQAIPWDSPSR